MLDWYTVFKKLSLWQYLWCLFWISQTVSTKVEIDVFRYFKLKRRVRHNHDMNHRAFFIASSPEGVKSNGYLKLNCFKIFLQIIDAEYAEEKKRLYLK